MRLKKNPRYWDATNTQLEVVDILPVGAANTALNLYETGAADVIWDKDLVPTEQFDFIKQRPDSHTFTYLGTYFFRFNVTRKPFDDVRVRRALALAIDRDRLTRRVTKAGESPADHLTPNGTAHYHAPHGLAYNPELARKLLMRTTIGERGDRIEWERMLLEAATGIDCRSFFDQRGMFQPLAAAARIE